ncbi:hypothetical protein ACTXT7_016867 [Hymenolepis weldensis]
MMEHKVYMVYEDQEAKSTIHLVHDHKRSSKCHSVSYLDVDSCNDSSVEMALNNLFPSFVVSQ